MAAKCFPKKRNQSSLMAFKSPWCANVIVTPEDNNRSVLTKGNPHTSKAWIVFGGQIAPTAMAGDKLTWKKAQKKAKKNIISEIINKSIPNLNPVRTAQVWYPCPDSSTTIINHPNKTVEKKNQEKLKTELSIHVKIKNLKGEDKKQSSLQAT